MHAKHNETEERTCHCPYCDHEIDDTCYPFCDGCGIKLFICPDCKKPFPKEMGICPNCGTRVSK